MKLISKPNEGEYAPYTISYVGLVPDDGLVLQHLADNLKQTIQLARSFSEEQLVTPCAPGEWTIKEILLHIIDTERIFAYRALRVARNDATALPGFEQDDYVPFSNANGRSLDSIFEEFTAVRQATLTLFQTFDETALTREGIVSGHTMSVRAAAYIIAGHELHHFNSIKENYKA